MANLNEIWNITSLCKKACDDIWGQSGLGHNTEIDKKD